MSRPRIPIGGYGEIAFLQRGKGKVEARTRFRDWDGQLRQPVLLADARALVSVSPQPGFQHQFSELDTLGTDRPETRCRFR